MAWENSVASGYLDLLERLRKFVCNIVDGVWQANTSYSAGTIIEPTTPNGFRYECITAGTSGGTEPAWPTNIGDTVTDGTAVWKCISTKLPSAQQWTTLKKTFDEVNGTDGELYLKAPGLDGTRNIYINFRTYSNPSSSVYSWILNTAIGFDTNLDFYSQPGAITTEAKCPKLNLYTVDINYWLVANGQRVVLVADVNTYIFSMYMGFIKAFLPPSSYGYPFLLEGSHYDFRSASDTANASLIYPAYASPKSSGYLRYIDGSYYYHSQAISLADNNFQIYPFNDTAGEQQTFPPNYDGSLLLIPALVLPLEGAGSDSQYFIGELDGIYWVAGSGVSTGDIVQVGTDEYLIFQDVDISSRFAAVKLEV